MEKQPMNWVGGNMNKADEINVQANQKIMSTSYGAAVRQDAVNEASTFSRIYLHPIGAVCNKSRLYKHNPRPRDVPTQAC